MKDSITLNYYNQNAQNFTQGTIDVNFEEIQERFLTLLTPGGKILDFGCGSGRDTKYFLGKGFIPEAVDGSEELCKIASQNTGIIVKHMLFSELDAIAAYDGIWACASILHLSKDQLKDVFFRMSRAIKENGYIYTSFKYGTFEGYRKGRFFTDFTEESFKKFVREIPDIKITDLWISEDVRPGRSDEKWLNLILQKSVTA